MAVTLAILPFPLLAVAVLLIYLGRRGRRVDRHPLCPDCGYDMAATHRDYRCSECGREITPWHDYKVGNRRPVPALIYAGCFLLPVAALGCFTLLSALAVPARAAPFKPLLVLRLDISSGFPASRDVALAEALRRFAAGRITAADLAPMVDHVLAVQADPGQPWTAAAGDFVEALRAKKAVSDRQWRAYAAHAVRIEIMPRDPRYPHAFYRFGLRLQTRTGRNPPFALSYVPRITCGSVLFDTRVYRPGPGRSRVVLAPVTPAAPITIIPDPRRPLPDLVLRVDEDDLPALDALPKPAPELVITGSFAIIDATAAAAAPITTTAPPVFSGTLDLHLDDPQAVAVVLNEARQWSAAWPRSRPRRKPATTPTTTPAGPPPASPARPQYPPAG